MLDRIIGRTLPVETMGPATVYVFTIAATGSPVGTFEYLRVSDTELHLAETATLQVLPGTVDLVSTMATPLAGVVVDVEGETPATLTMLDYTFVAADPFDTFGSAAHYELTFTGGILPAAGGFLTITFPGSLQTMDAAVEQWAQLRQGTPDDFLTFTDRIVYQINDRVFTVRYSKTWEVGSEFTFEGESYIVRGIEPIGRRRYLAMLARVGVT